MNMNELSREQLMLLNTEFPADIEKQAEAIVNEEMSKVAELEEVANGCYNYGAELAMAKIAEMEQKHEAKESEEEETDEEGAPKKKKELEKDAEADAMGNFILEGYWNTMMEKGAEFYGDSDIYLEELCKEAEFDKLAAKVAPGLFATVKKDAKKHFETGKAKVKEYASVANKHTQKHHKKYMGGALAVGAGAGYAAGHKKEAAPAAKAGKGFMDTMKGDIKKNFGAAKKNVQEFGVKANAHTKANHKKYIAGAGALGLGAGYAAGRD
jgi:hypothetical protein